MNLTKRIQTVVAGLALLGLAMPLSAATLVQTGFEAAEGFTVGESPDGVDNWSVQASTVTVRANGAAQGSQYLELSDGAILDYDFSTAQTGMVSDLVWVEGWFRGRGSTVTLEEAKDNYPTASAIVHFSEANGIEVLNGDGQGDGTPVSTGIALGEANEDTWHKVTLQISFGDKAWSIWVNNEQAGGPLGFRDDSVTNLNGFKNLAQGRSDFDAFRVVTPVFGDANGDQFVDSADLVRLIEFLTNPPTDDIILFTNSNIATAGTSATVIDQDDVTMLAGILSGQM